MPKLQRCRIGRTEMDQRLEIDAQLHAGMKNDDRCNVIGVGFRQGRPHGAAPTVDDLENALARRMQTVTK